MVTVKAPTNRRHHRGVPLKSAKGSMDMMSAYIARAGGYCGSDPTFAAWWLMRKRCGAARIIADGGRRCGHQMKPLRLCPTRPRGPAADPSAS